MTALVRPALRSMNWLPPAVVGACVIALVLLVGRSGPTPPVTLLVRVTGILVAAGMGGILDDPAQPSIAASPVPEWVRRGIRAGAGWLVAWVMWSSALAVLLIRFEVTGLPLSRLALEFATTLGLVTAAAGAALALGNASGSTAGASAVLAFAFVMVRAPEGLSLVTAPVGSAQYVAETTRWVVVLAVTMAIAGWHLRDPANRPLRSIRQGR